MTPPRAKLVLALSLIALLAVALTWVAWPERAGRADLVDRRPSSEGTRATPSTSSTSTTAPAPPLIEPVRVQIPALGLDTSVVPVGLDENGAMEIPPAADVGWYELGPSPGEPGSAVLAAHIDYDGQRGAFFDLRSLPDGAEVIVLGADGRRRAFTTTVREQVPKAGVDLARYFTNDGPARLTLITCGGAFDRNAGHYQDNIIVTAEPGPA
jgi:sortase (surface protein transpeptidase)